MSNIVLRPLQMWLDPVDPDPVRHSFKASWTQTTALLKREVDMLQRRWVEAEIILQLQVSEYWLRKDGGMKADAKVTGHGVVISFDSKFGPLRYATDRFVSSFGMPGWQANVRAIAMALEGLRMVDRYGVSRRGEQYTGFGALPAARAMGAAMSLEDAATMLRLFEKPEEANLPTDWDKLYKRAAKHWHPDVEGGDDAQFRKAKEAHTLLTQ